MSLKKATPKAVFDACESLELLERSWNRDDVRINIGGGSFSVIDPLIQAWRRLQPVREVAPSVPTDLLLKVATMLEQQVSEHVNEITVRDQEREQTLLEANEVIGNNLVKIEAELSERLETSQQSNHELEAECSRLEAELDGEKQLALSTAIKQQVLEESISSLKQQLMDQQKRYEQNLAQMALTEKEKEERVTSQHALQLKDLKNESQIQLTQQKTDLLSSAQIAENRLMRLIDQGRIELKELQTSSSSAIKDLTLAQQVDNQKISNKASKIQSLQSTLSNTEQQLKDLAIEHQEKLSSIEVKNLKLQKQAEIAASERNDLTGLKESILVLQQQLLKT